MLPYHHLLVFRLYPTFCRRSSRTVERTKKEGIDLCFSTEGSLPFFELWELTFGSPELVLQLYFSPIWVAKLCIFCFVGRHQPDVENHWNLRKPWDDRVGPFGWPFRYPKLSLPNLPSPQLSHQSRLYSSPFLSPWPSTQLIPNPRAQQRSARELPNPFGLQASVDINAA